MRLAPAIPRRANSLRDRPPTHGSGARRVQRGYARPEELWDYPEFRRRFDEAYAREADPAGRRAPSGARHARRRAGGRSSECRRRRTRLLPAQAALTCTDPLQCNPMFCGSSTSCESEDDFFIICGPGSMRTSAGCAVR
jgi:hypothetical protein